MNIKNVFSKGKAAVVAAVGSMFAASAAFADTHAGIITAAGTAGEATVTSSVSAVIGIVALVVGVSLAISFLRKI